MATNEKELELSFLDRQPHFRVYGRYLAFFPFPDVAYAEVAVKALRAGLAETLTRFPYLAGTVGLDDSIDQRLQILYSDPLDTETEASRILSINLDVATSPNYNYNELEEAGFPALDLPSAIICPGLLKDHPGLDEGDRFAEKSATLQKGIPLPPFAAQATFIPGGLVLSVWFYHAVSDGTGQARIQEVWSDAVRALTVASSRTSITALVEHIDHAAGNQKHFQDVEDAADDSPSAREALTELAAESETSIKPIRPRVNPHRAASYEVATKIFSIPSSTVSDLEKSLSELAKTHVSHFASLAALIWSHVLHVRMPLIIAAGNTKSTLAVVADLRKALEEPMSSRDHLGNTVLSAMPSWSIPSVTPGSIFQAPDLQHITALAVKITEAVRAIDEDWITSRFKHVYNDPTTTENAHLTFANGPDLYITSWQRMGADREWFIPGTSSAKPTAVRRAAWQSEGGIVVLPRREDDEAPYEIMVSLAEEEMAAFEQVMRESGWLGGDDEKAVQTGHKAQP
jgi:BAHD acyltransferase